MGRLVRGEVVVVPFPFSDLTRAKRRPALVVAALPGDDVILCQITSQTLRDGLAIALTDTDFIRGGLNRPSNIRPNRLFTAECALVLYSAGLLHRQSLERTIDAIVEILRKD